MTYLIIQMFICLLIAFLLGLLIGWLLCKIFCCRKDKHCDTGATCDAPQSAMSSTAAPAAAAASMASSSYDDEDDTVMIGLDTNVDLDADGYAIETLEGIGPQTGNLFRGYGVSSVGDYLRKLHAAPAREQAAKDLNILVKPLHDWASMSDLLRVEGIDHQYAELTYAAGIQTVNDLANSDASQLVNEMDRVNNSGKQHIAPTVPSADDVAGWIALAKNMSPVVSV